jgi:hypothetical protein
MVVDFFFSLQLLVVVFLQSLILMGFPFASIGISLISNQEGATCHDYGIESKYEKIQRPLEGLQVTLISKL